MAELVKQFVSGIYNLILGMFTTGKHLGRHAITIQYPKERWTMPERSRGMVVLLTDHDTGELNCTCCLLCEKACPSGAIDIEVEKDEKNKRHLVEFKVNYAICCLCGLCEESCNFAAIKLAPKYEYPEYDRKNLIWDKKKLAEMGFDVPYEKPVRKKKPVAAKAAAKQPDKTADDKTVEKTADKKPAEPASEKAKPDIEGPVDGKPSQEKAAGNEPNIDTKQGNEGPSPPTDDPGSESTGEKN